MQKIKFSLPQKFMGAEALLPARGNGPPGFHDALAILRARVELFVDRLEPGRVDVRVDLRGGDTGMA